MTPVVLVDESRGSVHLRQGRDGGAPTSGLAVPQRLAGKLDESPRGNVRRAAHRR